MKGINGRFVFIKKDRKRLWKEHMEKTMNKENAWNQKTENNIVEALVKEVSSEKITIAIKKMKLGKASGLSEVSMEMMNANGKVGIDMIMKFCQRVFDEKGIPKDWKASVMVPIHKEKRDVMNCNAYRGVKLLEHGMKIIERVLEKRIRALVEVNNMQFGFMQEKEQQVLFL